MALITVELLGGLDALFDQRSALELELDAMIAAAGAAGAGGAGAGAGAGAGVGAGVGAAAAGVASAPRAATVRDLLAYLRARFVRERPELFFAEASPAFAAGGAGGSAGGAEDALGVRPGILVLINDVDWELEGRLDCELRDGDVVAFISTLHGG